MLYQHVKRSVCGLLVVDLRKVQFTRYRVLSDKNDNNETSRAKNGSKNRTLNGFYNVLTELKVDVKMSRGNWYGFYKFR